MSIVLKLVNNKDTERWNQVIARDPQGTFFDKLEWCNGLSLVSKKLSSLPMLVEKNGEAISVFPACLVRETLGSYLESLPFSGYGGGPIFRNRDCLMDMTFSKNFYHSIIQLGKLNKCSKISIRRAHFPDLAAKDFIGKPVIVDSDTCTFVIDLAEGIDRVHQKIEDSRRRSIKQGEKRGTNIYEARNHSDLVAYYDIYLRTMDRLESAPVPFQFFNYIWDTFIPRNEAKIFIAEHKNRPIGGILLLIFGCVCNAWSGGSLYDYQDKRPMDVLISHSIKWAAESNLKSFDFGSTPNDPKSGHYFHKKTWGGQKVTLYNYHIILQPKLWRFYTFGYKLVRKVRSVGTVMNLFKS